ncbi:F-box protein FBW2 [Quercus robur]|uniref:F-box domain-containing protein n=1 Tax=Quercus lobata TaxID=97700 RepID=A0A7N2N686_QUELO|nr:F-box protein FBW2 [Quercus lobata]XP_030947752.1 F-box protein FBW2 [Quercus lobata]XP_030947753.1 F-box protein FBW2 [Quercus lobata]XP_030947754.1 F-box protein FBW2 [Quercus lobata]XP_030947755.1 F-box protein FBW2 [Quercus lobata]XP_050264974.1 F-box protein FBW2 [Quercus robur]XP_050264975.1 F-box protein FBW2 [Quercus robur]XP_050264976.1 F-box protein FBW2 [Quercus robur]XP_050264977.1 F-box protein FBW2 [Quercus robur]XP_050264978.1 F-box protein FBW2 [Quercus robur]
MEEGSDYRRWDELIPDALGLIFSNLPLQEILTVIPRVCKSWSKAVTGPYCWQEIDIEEWSNRCQPDHLDQMLEMLITRSCGSLRKLCVSGLHTEMIFNFIAKNAGSLQTLRLPRSEMSDSIVEQIASRLSMITFLDVSYCGKIGARALEAIGKNCKLLVGLCRNLHPLDTAGKPLQDDEAYAIASTMPKLKHLEMAYHLISTTSVLKILSSCPELGFLDLRGCWDVKLDDKFLKDKFPKLKVLGPLVIDHYERNDWDDCSDSSDAFEYLAWEFVAGEMGEFDEDEDDESYWDDEGRLEELELRFYEGNNEDAELYGWPPSP